MTDIAIGDAPDFRGTSRSVLDHGLVRLVDYMGSDLSVVRSARVSYDGAWRTGEDGGSDERLLHRLFSHNHNTPFESVTFTFEVRAPIFTIRQWHRHRTQSYNELSARYRELPEFFYIPEEDVIGEQMKHEKQMRDQGTRNASAGLIRHRIRLQNESAFETYRELLAKGCPRELARSVLPMGTYSHMFTTMNLHNLRRFIQERSDPHAQHEIQVYSNAMLDLISPVVPVISGLIRAELGLTL